MIDKQIIKKFSDNHCLVLENNQISLRENEFTAYRIVLGKSTNELLEFVKDTYLQLTRKTQECEELKDKIKFMEGYIKTVENARDELERENKFSKEQAEQKLERIAEFVKTFDEEDETRIIILQIIDEVE